MKNKLTPIARKLRKNMTDAELKLWYHLRNKQIGVKFRRQCPIGNYIVDFVSFEARLYSRSRWWAAFRIRIR